MSLTKVSYSMIAGSPANAVDFGVVADGSTDNSAALQAAFDYATANGCKLVLPSGIINIESPVIVDVTANSNGLSIEIEGQGSESTIISYTNSADVDALSFIGNYASRVVISGFAVKNDGASTNSNGIVIKKIYGGMFNDVRVSAFRVNFSCVDVNSLKFLRLMSNAATYAGMTMGLGIGGNSYPNLNDFDSCNFINNYQHAIYIDNGTNNTFRSCNFGQNGNATDINSSTIRMNNMYGGNGGGFTLIENCYFEGNLGRDFWTTCNGEGAYNFINNSFNKIAGGNNVTNHIYLDASLLTSGTNLENRLVMVGNSFAKLNGYTGTGEDVQLIYGTGGFTNFVVVDENVYGAKSETPTTYNLPAIAQNNDRSATANKIVSVLLEGKDSAGNVKNGALLEAISYDKNWLDSYGQIKTRRGDVEVIPVELGTTFYPLVINEQFDNGSFALFNGRASSTAANMAVFNLGGNTVGTISSTTTATAYNTSSDYRLKENVQPMQNALAVVQQLNPVTYTWKSNGEFGQGFIAHELQTVVPDAVTGEKDAVDAEGKPVYQGVDTSFLVATLTKAIQELKVEFDEYKATHP